jgi:hypothetical protein
MAFTLAEKRLITCAVSKLDSKKPLRPYEVPVTRITAAEYAEVFEVSLDTAYDQLQDGAKHLYNRSITFYEAAHRRNGKPLPPTRVQMRWIGSASIRRARLGRTALVAGLVAAPHGPETPVHELPAQTGQRPAFGLFVEAAGAADAL